MKRWTRMRGCQTYDRCWRSRLKFKRDEHLEDSCLGGLGEEKERKGEEGRKDIRMRRVQKRRVDQNSERGTEL
jgi:hypothetical protein